MLRKFSGVLAVLLLTATALNASLFDHMKSFFWGAKPAPVPQIKVLLVNDQPAVSLEARGKYKLYDPNIKEHITSRLIGKKKLVQSLSSGLKWGEEFPGTYQFHLIPETAKDEVFVDGIQYPGSLYVYDIGGTLSVVNEVDVDSYLARVLPLQYPESFPEETMAALVIAARTQCLYQAKNPKNTFWDTDGQLTGYKKEAKPASPELLSAIRATRNMVLSVTGAYEGTLTPVLAEWGPQAGERNPATMLSKISLHDAEEMGRKGKVASEILESAFPKAHIELVQ